MFTRSYFPEHYFTGSYFPDRHVPVTVAGKGKFFGGRERMIRMLLAQEMNRSILDNVRRGQTQYVRHRLNDVIELWQMEANEQNRQLVQSSYTVLLSEL